MTCGREWSYFLPRHADSLEQFTGFDDATLSELYNKLCGCVSQEDLVQIYGYAHNFPAQGTHKAVMGRPVSSRQYINAAAMLVHELGRDLFIDSSVRQIDNWLVAAQLASRTN